MSGKDQLCYLRGKWINEPLPLPPKVNKKLSLVLQELTIPILPQKLIATEENEMLFDELRENILKMFCLQRYIRKRDQEKKKMEEKFKKQSTPHEEFQPPVEVEKRKNPYSTSDYETVYPKKIKTQPIQQP